MKKQSIVIALVIAMLATVFTVPALAYTSYVETTGSVNIRSGPGPGYSRVSTASSGTWLDYLGATRYDYRDIAWYKVSCSAGKGWVSSVYSHLVNEPDPEPYGSYVEITASVNIRSGPSLYHDVISTASKGSTFAYLDSTRYDNRDVAWYKISCSKGVGWVSSTYAWLEEEPYEEYVETLASTNLRRGPGLDYRIITSVAEGELLIYDGRTSYDDRGIAWYRIDYDGQTAWVSSVYSQLY